MKSMKKIFSFVIAFSLLLSIAPFSFATEELTEVTSYQLDIPYNSDFIAKKGDTVDKTTWLGGEATAAHILANKSWNIARSINGINGGKSVFNNNTVTYSSKSEGFDISFNIPTENLSGGVNDSVKIFRQTTSTADGSIIPADTGVTFDGSKRPSDGLYVLARVNGSYCIVPITITYTDGTVTTASITFASAGYCSLYPDGADDRRTCYAKVGLNNDAVNLNDSGVIDTAKYKEEVTDETTGETTIVSTAVTTDSALVVKKIATDTTRSIEKIQFGTVASGDMIILAVSEGALSNEELKAAVSADLSEASKDEIRFAQACAKELNANRNDTTDYSAIFALDGRIEVDSYMLDLPYDADMITTVGNVVDINTFDGGAAQAAARGDSSSVDTIILPNYTTAYFQGCTVANSTSYPKDAAVVAELQSAISKIDFKFADNYDSGSVLDTIYRYKDDEKGNINISASQRPAKRLYFAYMIANSNPTVPVKMNFTDGSSTTVSLYPKGYYSSWGGAAQWAQYVGGRTYNNARYNAVFDETTGKYVSKHVNDSLDAKISISYLDIPENKVLKSFDLGGCSNVHGVAYYAITEEARTNAELLAAVNKDLSKASDAEKIYAKACAKELNENRNDYSDYSAIYNIEVLDTVNEYKLSLPYNADFIAYSGDKVGDTWLRDPDLRAYLEAQGDQGTARAINGINATINGIFTDGGINYASHANNSLNADFSKIAFSVPSENLKGGVNDAMTFFRSAKLTEGDVVTQIPADTAKTVTASGRPSDSLYFLYRSSGSGTTSTLTLNYTDGSSENVAVKFPGSAYTSTGVVDGKTTVLAKLFMGYSSIKADDTNTIVSGPTTDSSIQVLKCDLTAGKVLKDFSISAVSSGDYVLFAISESALSNEDLKEAININRLSSAAEISYAKECVAELIKRGGVASNYNYVDVLYNNIVLNADNPEYIYTDLSSYYNADMIGKAGDSVTDSWLGGFTAGENFGPYNAEKMSHSDGIISTPEYTGGGEGTEEIPFTFTATGNTVKAKIPVEAMAGGVDDAVTIKDGVTIPLSGRPLDKIYIATSANMTWNGVINGRFNYSDGTNEAFTIAPFDFYRADYYKTSATNNLLQVHNDYTGLYSMGTNSVAVNNGVLEAYKSSTIGIHIIGKEVSDKKVASITFNATGNTFLLNALTEVPLSTTYMHEYITDVIASAAEKGYADNLETTSQADEYVDELVRRGIYTTEDEEYTKIKAFVNQLQYDATVYVDLSDYLDTDVIVPANTEIPEDYSGRKDAKSANDKTYNAGAIPENGKISFNAPSRNDVNDGNGKIFTTADFPAPITDASFQLSGSYKGFGNDAVLVAADDEDGVTIEFAETEKRKYKDIYFLLDAPNGEQIGQYTVPVTITFTDGTTQTARTNLFYNTTYYGANFYSYFGLGNVLAETEKTDAEGNAYSVFAADTTKYPDTGKFFPSELNPTVTTDEEGNKTFTETALVNKEIASVTFGPSSGTKESSYTILGITAIPYSTEDLVDTWLTGFDAWYENEAVTYDNIDVVEAGAKAGVELYTVRSVNDENVINEEYYNLAVAMLDEVDRLRQLDDKGFEVVPSITVENGIVKATATVANGTNEGKTAVIIIAVYGENNKLLNTNISDIYSFNAGILNESMEISCEDVDGAVSYKAMVMSSLDSLRPIVYTTK